MIELENLRANFAAVLRMASLAEIETMLRALGAELEPRFHDASLSLYQAAEQLNQYLRGKRPQRPVDADAHHPLRCNDPGCDNPMHRRL